MHLECFLLYLQSLDVSLSLKNRMKMVELLMIPDLMALI